MKTHLLLVIARNRVGIIATADPRAELAELVALGSKTISHCTIPTHAAEEVARAVCLELSEHALGVGACWFAVHFDTLIATTSRALKALGGDEPVRVGGIDRGTRAMVAA